MKKINKKYREKNIDKFCVIIDILNKYEVLNGLGDDIYNELHKLRKYRNKIHIHDDINIDGVSRDEKDAFSGEICIWAIGLNFSVISYLSNKLSRPRDINIYVRSLYLPS